jgi:hypothetical protein
MASFAYQQFEPIPRISTFSELFHFPHNDSPNLFAMFAYESIPVPIFVE